MPNCTYWAANHILTTNDRVYGNSAICSSIIVIIARRALVDIPTWVLTRMRLRNSDIRSAPWFPFTPNSYSTAIAMIRNHACPSSVSHKCDSGYLFLLAIAAKLRATLSLDSPTALPILRNDRLPNSAMLANTCLSRLRIAVLIFFSAPCYVFGCICQLKNQPFSHRKTDHRWQEPM